MAVRDLSSLAYRRESGNRQKERRRAFDSEMFEKRLVGAGTDDGQAGGTAVGENRKVRSESTRFGTSLVAKDNRSEHRESCSLTQLATGTARVLPLLHPYWSCYPSTEVGIVSGEETDKGMDRILRNIHSPAGTRGCDGPSGDRVNPPFFNDPSSPATRTEYLLQRLTQTPTTAARKNTAHKDYPKVNSSDNGQTYKVTGDHEKLWRTKQKKPNRSYTDNTRVRPLQVTLDSLREATENGTSSWRAPSRAVSCCLTVESVNGMQRGEKSATKA